MAAVQTQDVLEKRDAAALTEKMTALDDVGWAKGSPGLYLVVTESGACYRVDHQEERCNCSDQFYRNPSGGCKHIRRVAYALGERQIPNWVNQRRVDDQLGDHVTEGGR
ncbi:hypothetical protein V9T20_12535 (plasmid) [Halobacterium salinarum]|uniref:hypothetical protein n=1 Tax=Halobacterium salinarum TaxID=2242 RepID=UPI0030CAD80B